MFSRYWMINNITEKMSSDKNEAVNEEKQWDIAGVTFLIKSKIHLHHTRRSCNYDRLACFYPFR